MGNVIQFPDPISSKYKEYADLLSNHVLTFINEVGVWCHYVVYSSVTSKGYAMKKLTVIVIMFLAFMPTIGVAGWDKVDYALAGSYVILHAMDYAQTVQIVGNDKYREANPLLGSDPSRAKVNAFFLGTTAGILWYADTLPDEQRPWFLGTVTLLAAYVVHHNYQVGLSISF